MILLQKRKRQTWDEVFKGGYPRNALHKTSLETGVYGIIRTFLESTVFLLVFCYCTKGGKSRKLKTECIEYSQENIPERLFIYAQKVCFSKAEKYCPGWPKNLKHPSFFLFFSKFPVRFGRWEWPLVAEKRSLLKAATASHRGATPPERSLLCLSIWQSTLLSFSESQTFFGKNKLHLLIK